MSIYAISVLFFLTAALLVVAIGSPRRQAVLRRLHKYGSADDLTDYERQLNQPLVEKLLGLFAGRLVSLVTRLLPNQMAADIEKRLEQSAHPHGLTVSTFLLIKVGLLLALPAAYGSYLLLTSRAAPSMLQLLFLVASFYVGFRGPDWWLQRQVEARQKAINRALPDALDFIVVCVEAGLAFEGAIARVVHRVRGPLAEEFKRTLGEISLGKRRRDAMRDMASRTQAADLVSFIAAVVQADQTGISIGDVLRIQADDLRLRRRQRAEKEGREAPLKMLLPLIFFIFPATFIASVGPAALQIMDQMVKGG